MTIRVITSSAPIAGAVAAHTYSTPVVRELPKPPADPAGDRSW